MKIVLLCVLLLSAVSALVTGIADGDWFSGIFRELAGNLLFSGITAIGFVTLIFAILERQHVKVELKKDKEWVSSSLGKMNSAVSGWNTGRLKPVPDKRGLISRADSVAGIVFCRCTH